MARRPGGFPSWRRRLLALLTFVVLSGCVRREGRNSDCLWPRSSEPNASVPGQRDLRADLEFAEELAVRYMDAHYGPGSPEAAAQAKNRCMGILLGEIGKEHGITARQAFTSFGRRSAAIDLAINLPFVLLYAAAADFTIRRLLGRHPPGEGWVGSIVMSVLVSVAFSISGVIVGQQWSAVAESIRIGTAHLSNRGLRLPLNKHPGEGFLFGIALFLTIAIVRYRGPRHAPVRP